MGDVEHDEQHDDAAASYLARALLRVRQAEAAAVQARADAMRVADRIRELRRQARCGDPEADE